MFDDPIHLALMLFGLGGVAFALAFGRAAERAAALIVAANLAFGIAKDSLFPGYGPLLQLANDALAALAMLGITLRYGAPWMGGMMLFFAAQFALHSYYLVTERPNDNLHALINNANWSAVVWCLIIGTAVAWRRRAVAERAAAIRPAA